MQQIANLLDVLGVSRMDDLLFKCQPSLKGKAQGVHTEKTTCSKCGMPNIYKWSFTINGEQKEYQVDTVCSACYKGKESKTLTEEFEEKRKIKINKTWYNIDPYDESGFKNYQTISKATERALKEAKDYAKEILSGNKNLNLLMMGSTGTGKSHIAKALARTFKDKGLDVAYIEAIELFNMIKSTFGNDKEKERLMKQYSAFDVVFIDDVGLETKKIDEVSWSVSEWTSLINAREGKSSIWTTNFDDSALENVIGKRSFSRMYMNTRFIDLFTDDYRKRLRVH